MDLPKNWTEYAIWMGMQFPMLGAAALAAYWAIRFADRRHEQVYKAKDEVTAEKERQIKDRDRRIRRLERELDEVREKLWRLTKPEGEP